MSARSYTRQSQWRSLSPWRRFGVATTPRPTSLPCVFTHSPGSRGGSTGRQVPNERLPMPHPTTLPHEGHCCLKDGWNPAADQLPDKHRDLVVCSHADEWAAVAALIASEVQEAKAELATAAPALRPDTPPPALPETNGGFQTVLADPPWRFTNRTGKVAPEHRRLDRYSTMTLADICALPVETVVAEDAHLYLWVPNALPSRRTPSDGVLGLRYVSNIVGPNAARTADQTAEGRVLLPQRHRTPPIRCSWPHAHPSLPPAPRST